MTKDKDRKKRLKEKELLEIENLKLQKREHLTSIVSAVIVAAVTVITAIVEWFFK